MKRHTPVRIPCPVSPAGARHARGFTLVEMMVTVGIAVILLGVAAPSFSSYIRSQRVKTAAIDINMALILARSEAIKRNNNVTLTPATGGWINGWTISTTVGGTTTTIRQQGAYTGLTFSGPASAVTYSADGRITSTAAPSFQISSTDAIRCVSVSLSGLPNSKSGSC